MSTDIKTAKENLFGLMEMFTQANLNKIICMVTVGMNGQMAGFMKVNGSLIKCTVKASLPGQTVGYMMVIMFRIRRRVKDHSLGLTDANFMVDGRMASKMVMLFTVQQKDNNEKACGKMESVSNGYSSMAMSKIFDSIM